MIHRTASAQQRQLSHQACQVKTRYPELYAFLKQRDTMLDRAVSTIPSPSDVELSSAFDLHAHVEGTVANVPPGLSRLVEVRQEE